MLLRVKEKDNVKTLEKLAGSAGGAVPLGSLVLFEDTSKLPDGYLLCDGSSFDTAKYPLLMSYLGDTKVPLKEYQDDSMPIGTVVRTGKYFGTQPVFRYVARANNTGSQSSGWWQIPNSATVVNELGITKIVSSYMADHADTSAGYVHGACNCNIHLNTNGYLYIYNGSMATNVPSDVNGNNFYVIEFISSILEDTIPPKYYAIKATSSIREGSSEAAEVTAAVDEIKSYAESVAKFPISNVKDIDSGSLTSNVVKTRDATFEEDGWLSIYVEAPAANDAATWGSIYLPNGTHYRFANQSQQYSRGMFWGSRASVTIPVCAGSKVVYSVMSYGTGSYEVKQIY